MSDNFNEFFDSHAQWTENDSKPSSSNSNSEKSSKSRAKARVVEKRRKRRARTVLVFLLVMVLGVVSYVGYSAVHSLRLSHDNETVADWPGPGFGSVEFTVDTGEGAIAIGSKLAKANIVKSQAAFTSAVTANNKILYPGVYVLKKAHGCY